MWDLRERERERGTGHKKARQERGGWVVCVQRRTYYVLYIVSQQREEKRGQVQCSTGEAGWRVALWACAHGIQAW